MNYFKNQIVKIVTFSLFFFFTISLTSCDLFLAVILPASTVHIEYDSIDPTGKIIYLKLTRDNSSVPQSLYQTNDKSTLIDFKHYISANSSNNDLTVIYGIYVNGNMCISVNRVVSKYENISLSAKKNTVYSETGESIDLPAFNAAVHP